MSSLSPTARGSSTSPQSPQSSRSSLLAGGASCDSAGATGASALPLLPPSLLLRNNVSLCLERHFCDTLVRKILHWTFVDIEEDDPDWLSRAECACCAATHVVEVLFHDLVHNTFIVHRYGLNISHCGRSVHITSDEFAASRHPYCDAKRLDNFFYDQFCASLRAQPQQQQKQRQETQQQKQTTVHRQKGASSDAIPIPVLTGVLSRRGGTFSRLIRRNSGSKRPDLLASSASVLSASPPPLVANWPDSISPPCGAPVFFGVACRRLPIIQTTNGNNLKRANSGRDGARDSASSSSFDVGSADNTVDLTDFFDLLATPPSSRPITRCNSRSHATTRDTTIEEAAIFL